MGTPFSPFGQMGVSFAPTTEQASLGPQRGAMEGVQQLLKILSLRLPQNLGQGSIAPRSLLEQPTNRPDQAAIQTILRSLMQAQSQPDMTDSSPVQAPIPRFSPAGGGGGGAVFGSNGQTADPFARFGGLSGPWPQRPVLPMTPPAPRPPMGPLNTSPRGGRVQY